MLERIGAKPDEWVLVTAATGGLGVLLVQLAEAAGARVVAQRAARRSSGSSARWEPTRSSTTPSGLGGARPATHRRIGRRRGLRRRGRHDRSGGVRHHRTRREVLRPRDTERSFTSVDPELAADRGITVTGIEQAQFAPEDIERLVASALAEAESRRIRPVIGQTFPLDRAADAHAGIENRTTVGKTLILP